MIMRCLKFANDTKVVNKHANRSICWPKDVHKWIRSKHDFLAKIHNWITSSTLTLALLGGGHPPLWFFPIFFRGRRIQWGYCRYCPTLISNRKRKLVFSRPEVVINTQWKAPLDSATPKTWVSTLEFRRYLIPQRRYNYFRSGKGQFPFPGTHHCQSVLAIGQLDSAIPKTWVSTSEFYE